MRRYFLVAFPALATVMGLAYLLGDPIRTDTPSFAFARSLAPMQCWGLVFLAGAVAIAVGLILNDPQLTALALFVGGFVYTWWGLCFAVEALSDPRASLNAWAVYFCVGLAHYYAAWRVRNPM